MNYLYKYDSDGIVEGKPKENIERNKGLLEYSVFDWRYFKRVMLIGAGPSLDDKWEEIRKLQADGWSIFCTSRGLCCLQKHSIMPDLVWHIDPYADFYFRKPMEIAKIYMCGSTLCVSEYANNSILQQWKDNGGVIRSYKSQRWNVELKSGYLTEGNHVGSTMAGFAMQQKAEEIKYFGYDYCFPGQHVKWEDDEGVACFQMYADPINGGWMGFKSQNFITSKYHPIISPLFEIAVHTFPYEVKPGLFTVDNMRINKMYLIEMIKKYKYPMPDLGDWS